MTTRLNIPIYDESKIKTLSSLEHIRLRTGMYIGRLGDGSNPDDGIYVLLDFDPYITDPVNERYIKEIAIFIPACKSKG